MEPHVYWFRSSLLGGVICYSNRARIVTETLPVGAHKSLMHLLVTVPTLPAAALHTKHSSRQPTNSRITAPDSNLKARWRGHMWIDWLFNSAYSSQSKFIYWLHPPLSIGQFCNLFTFIIFSVSFFMPSVSFSLIQRCLPFWKRRVWQHCRRPQGW